MNIQQAGAFGDSNSGEYYFNKILTTILSDINLYNKYAETLKSNLILAFQDDEWLTSIIQDLIAESNNPDSRINFGGSLLPSISSNITTTQSFAYIPDAGIVILKVRDYLENKRTNSINNVIKRKIEDMKVDAKDDFTSKKPKVVSHISADDESDKSSIHSLSWDGMEEKEEEKCNFQRRLSSSSVTSQNSNSFDKENFMYISTRNSAKKILKKSLILIQPNDTEIDAKQTNKVENMRNFFDRILNFNKKRVRPHSIKELSDIFDNKVTADKDFPQTSSELIAFLLGLTSLNYIYDNKLRHYRGKRYFVFNSISNNRNEKFCHRRALYSALIPDFDMQTNWIFAYEEAIKQISHYPDLARNLHSCTQTYLRKYLTDAEVIKYLIHESNFSINGITQVKKVSVDLQTKIDAAQTVLTENVGELYSSIKTIINIHLIQSGEANNKTSTEDKQITGMLIYANIINKHKKFTVQSLIKAPVNHEEAFNNIKFYLNLLQNKNLIDENLPSHITASELENLKNANFSEDEIQACLALISLRHQNGTSILIGYRIRNDSSLTTTDSLISKEAWFILLPVEIRKEFILICNKIIENMLNLPPKFCTRFYTLMFFPLKRIHGEDKKIISSNTKDFLCDKEALYQPFNQLDNEIVEGIKSIQLEFQKYYPKAIEFLEEVCNFTNYKECEEVFSKPLTYRSTRQNKGRLTTIEKKNAYQGNFIYVVSKERGALGQADLKGEEALQATRDFIKQTSSYIERSKSTYYNLQKIKDKFTDTNNSEQNRSYTPEIRKLLNLGDEMMDNASLDELEMKVKQKLKQEIQEILELKTSKEDLMIFGIMLGSIYLPNKLQFSFSHYKIGKSNKVNPISSFSYLLVSHLNPLGNQELYEKFERCISYLSFLPRDISDKIHSLLKNTINHAIDGVSKSEERQAVIDFLYAAKDRDISNYSKIEENLNKIRCKLSEEMEKVLYEALRIIDFPKEMSKKGVYMGPTIKFISLAEAQEENICLTLNLAVDLNTNNIQSSFSEPPELVLSSVDYQKNTDDKNDMDENLLFINETGYSPRQMQGINEKAYHGGELDDLSREALYKAILSFESPITANDKLYYFILCTNQIRYDGAVNKFVMINNFNINDRNSLEGRYLRKLYTYGKNNKDLYEQNVQCKYYETIKNIMDQMNQIVEVKYIHLNLHAVKMHYANGKACEIYNASDIATKKYYTNSIYRSLLYFGQRDKLTNEDLMQLYVQEMLKNYHFHSVLKKNITPAPINLTNNIKGFLWPRDKQIFIDGERFQLSSTFFTQRLPRNFSLELSERLEYTQAFMRDIEGDNSYKPEKQYEFFIEGGEVGYDSNKKLVFITLSQFCYSTREFTGMWKFDKTKGWTLITLEEEAEEALIKEFKKLNSEYAPIIIKRNPDVIKYDPYHQDLFFKYICGKIIMFEEAISQETLKEIKSIYPVQDIISIDAEAFEAMCANCIQINYNTIYLSNPDAPLLFIKLMNENGINVMVSPLNTALGLDTGANCATVSRPSSPDMIRNV